MQDKQETAAHSDLGPKDEPEIVKFTAKLTETEDPEQASRIADMLLLFIAAGGTVLGCLLAATAAVVLLTSKLSQGLGIASLLICVGVGGGLGFLVVSSLLHMKGLVRWERARSERASRPPPH